MNKLGDNMPAQTPHKILISVLGLSEYECRLVRSVLSLSSTSGRAHAYALLDAANAQHIEGHTSQHIPHITILDPDNAAAALAWQSFKEQAHQQGQHEPAQLWITHTAPQEPGKHFLLRPLAPTKMLALLDLIANRVALQSNVASPSIPRVPAVSVAQVASVAPATNIAPAPVTNAVKVSQPATIQTTVPTASATPAMAVPPTAPAFTPKCSFRALVVDDSPTVRIKIESELLPMGVASDCAETGEQALQMLAKNEYDIVFLDIVLPGADGYEVCRKIKHNRDTKRLPVVMLTSKSSPFDRIRGSLAGCSTYLTKPVDHASFHAVVEKYLAQALAQRAAVKDHGIPVFA